MRVRTDGNVAIHVPDPGRAEQFYSDLLGVALLRKSADRLDYDTGVLKLFVAKDDRIIPFIPALEVYDCQAAKARLVESGCTIIKEFAGHKAFYFADPFGLVIDVIQREK